jgi:hypothetical protein
VGFSPSIFTREPKKADASRSRGEGSLVSVRSSRPFVIGLESLLELLARSGVQVDHVLLT